MCSARPTSGNARCGQASRSQSRHPVPIGPGLERRPVLVNGTAGVLALRDGRPQSLMGCTVVDGRIVSIDIIADRRRLAAMDLGDVVGP